MTNVPGGHHRHDTPANVRTVPATAGGSPVWAFESARPNAGQAAPAASAWSTSRRESMGRIVAISDKRVRIALLPTTCLPSLSLPALHHKLDP